jgi:polyisoprenoid-binding protein YceI
MRLTLMLSLCCWCFAGYAQKLVPVDRGSKVMFRIKNFGFNTTGYFTGLNGSIVFDPSTPTSGLMNVTVDATTIDTDNNTRDNHLRKEDYFDVKNFPKIRFISTGIHSTTKAGTLIVSGKLTLKKTTKDISFPFTVVAVKDGYLFKGEFKLNRRDYGIGGGSTVADNLLVCLEVFAQRS